MSAEKFFGRVEVPDEGRSSGRAASKEVLAQCSLNKSMDKANERTFVSHFYFGYLPEAEDI